MGMEFALLAFAYGLGRIGLVWGGCIGTGQDWQTCKIERGDESGFGKADFAVLHHVDAQYVK
jgi:hypothetical protein